jgi:peptidoglycan/LPS O-acetylase OafA/YrhL
MLTLAGVWILALAVPLVCVWIYPLPSWHESAATAFGGAQVYRVRRLPILALPEFLAGISLGWIYIRFPPNRKTASLLATTGVVTLILVLALSDYLPYVLLHNGLLIPIFGMLLLGLGEPNWFSGILSNPVLILFGEASYALYLIHFLFNAWVGQVIGDHGTIVSALWKLAVTIPLSVILHLYVERPCRRLILQWWSHRHPSELKVANG